jgi:hypothetical protein
MASSSILIPMFVIAVVRSASHEATTGRPLSEAASGGAISVAAK